MKIRTQVIEETGRMIKLFPRTCAIDAVLILFAGTVLFPIVEGVLGLL